MAVELTESHHGLQGTGIREIVLVEDIIHGLCCHLIQGVLHEARQTELELHQVADEHHQVLAEALELLQINIHILQFLAVLANAGIDFLKPALVGAIDIAHHLSDVRLFADAKTVVDGWHMETGLEDTQLWQHGQIGDT